MAAILGHVFPVFAGFRGGKGVATTFGVLLALHPWLTLTCAGIFLVVLLISRLCVTRLDDSVSNVPGAADDRFPHPSLMLKIFAVVVAVAVVADPHQKHSG